MSDQEIITNYLSLLKSNVEVYVHGTIESSNEQVRKTIKNGLDTTLSSQTSTFNEMVSEKMYQISNVKIEEISKILDKLQRNVKKDNN